MVRPATQSGLGTSLENALKTPRTARSARPVTTHAARTLRLGTASMMTQPDGPFIQVGFKVFNRIFSSNYLCYLQIEF